MALNRLSARGAYEGYKADNELRFRATFTVVPEAAVRRRKQLAN